MNDLTIINKMMKELELAKGNPDNREELLTHIRHVKLLSELFLEDEGRSSAQTTPENLVFNEQERKAMLGEKMNPNQRQQPTKTQQTKLDHEDANGDSIFDF